MSEGFDLSGATVEGVRMGVGNHICWIRDFEYKDNSKGSKQLVVQLVSKRDCDASLEVSSDSRWPR